MKKKIYKNVIVGTGFSAFVFNFFLKKECLVITSKQKFTNHLPVRKNLNQFLKPFSKKFESFGGHKFSLFHSSLHDTLIDGGNTNLWGGICNIARIKNLIRLFDKTISFKKISISDTGSFSNNDNLYQMQKFKSNDGDIFNCKNFFKNKIYGHLVKFKALNKNLIELKVQRKKLETLQCKNLILAVNTVQLIELLINSKIITNNDLVSIEDYKFRTRITFFKKIDIEKNIKLILSYSVSGIIKHALGIQKNFNTFLFNFLNYFSFYYHQIFYKKKIKAFYNINTEKKIVQEQRSKTSKNFGKSIHYFNLKINNLKLEKKIKYFNKRIFGVSTPFLTKAEPGPISNFLIEKSFILAKKLNK